MTESLTDIESLVLLCRETKSREYIREAVLCYRSGAYRSTIVNVWIAVVFDLIDKIRELSMAGSQPARVLLTKYETYLSQIEENNQQGVKGALEFEREILGNCKRELQFFDHVQYSDLMRLREDRHQCAHPSFQQPGQPFRPSAELARLHLRNAVLHVLSQPPLQGKEAISAILSEIASTYFPQDLEKAVAVLGRSPIRNGPDSLIRGLVDALVFGVVDPSNFLYGLPQVASALNALVHLRRQDAEERLTNQAGKVIRQVSDRDLHHAITLMVRVPSLFELVEEPSLIRIGEFIRCGPEETVLPVLNCLGKHQRFQSEVISRVDLLEENSLEEAIRNYGLRESAKERVLRTLSESQDWKRSNYLFNSFLFPIFDILSIEDLERILRMPSETNADLPGSRGFEMFLQLIQRNELIPTDRINMILNRNV